MVLPISRRNALRNLALLAPTASVAGAFISPTTEPSIPPTGKLKLSLNAYSFNKPLMDGSMKLDDLLEFCAMQNIDGVDLTGYYFPGYPVVPPDEFLYELKRKAFKLGVDISGTGVRNDFTNPDAAKRKEDIDLIKNWIVCASKIGAPVIRIFSGTRIPKEYDWHTISEWMVKDIKECVAFGKAHGVVVAIQNHNDFLKTAEETIDIVKRVNSPWFGLILDIGSFRKGDPYPEIERCIPYAVNWQIKELVYVNDREEKVNLKKLSKIIKASTYRGYLPIETLGPGDPFVKVPIFLKEVREAMG
ncbi:sugar phosphate isomerase/epimerase family protein [Dyadobacter sp. 32]|uniref:sugar phosphate isomerase/epimerase family protein n=1 Tax=Dyadobacter sp. 32 TaxID=538966 RepID=UPI0011F08082